MGFTHSEKSLGDWLRSIKAGRAPNVQVVGQEIADELQGVVQVADYNHMAPPLRWTASGANSVVAGVAGQFSRVEIRAVNPFYFKRLINAQTVRMYTIPFHLAAGDITPTAVWGEAPTIRYREQSLVDPFILRTPEFLGGTGGYEFQHEMFVPRGVIHVIINVTAGLILNCNWTVEEVPNLNTAP